MKLFIFFLIFLLLFSQFGNSFELNTNKENDIQDISPKTENNFLSDSSYNQNNSEDKISSINNVEQIQTNETTNITSRPLVFSHLLENGEVWSNGTHNKAVITTQSQNIYDSDNNTYAKYLLKKIGNSYYLQSAYGLWRLNKETGVVLLNKNTNQTIYDSETWSLIYNGVERTETSKQIKLIEKNQENLTIEVSKSYSEGILNVSYHWIQGRLKINVLIKAFVVGNFRVGLKITGLDQFTTTDLINLNKSNFVLNFADMESQIDYAHSSFVAGVLTLVSNSYTLNIDDQRELDPTSYETNDNNDFHFFSNFAYSVYSVETDATTIYVGNNTGGGGRIYRGFIRHNLDFIGYYSKILESNISLYYGGGDVANLDSNISLLGWDITEEPITEDNYPPTQGERELTFKNYYLHNGTNYNVTIKLGDQQASLEAGDEFIWNITDFTQEWINGRNTCNIGFQIRNPIESEYNFIRFYDAQHATGQAPTLTITWVDDVIPPFISSNQSTDWVNINAFNITAYDQPTSSTSGLNLSSLAYSLNYASWIIVPDANIVSISDNTTFPTYFIVNNLLSEGSSTISFRIADLNGNWGYSNSSFGKQYYPKFTGDYAFRNETAQLGWGEEWTEETTNWVIESDILGEISVVNGFYNNAINLTVKNTANLTAFYRTLGSIDLSEYSKVSFWAKSSINDFDWSYFRIISTTNADFIQKSFPATITNANEWIYYEYALSDFVVYGSFNASDIKTIRWRAVEGNYTLFLDGLHFENEDGDSATENVDTNTLGTYSTVAADSSTITANTDSFLGYESIQYEVNDSNAEWAFKYLYTHTLDISNTDSFTFTIKRNETAYIIARITLYDEDSDYLKYEPDISLSTSFVTQTFVLADLTEGGSFNSSSLSQIYIIVYKSGGGSVKINFDALNFYKANNTVGFDETDPSIDSITVSEDLLNPWDHVCYNGSIIYYSNDQSMDSPLNLTVVGSDSLSGFGTFNTSVEWNDGTNISKSGLTATIIFNYTISESETAENITITIYDQAGNSDSETILTELDNTSPEAFIIEIELTTLYSSCGYIITTTSDSGAGLLYISVYLDTYRTNVSSGTNEFCNFPVGWSKIYAVAFDNVANSVLANNSGYVNVLADYEAKTTTVRDATQDPLSDAMVVLLDWYGGITIALGIILILFIVRRMIK